MNYEFFDTPLGQYGAPVGAAAAGYFLFKSHPFIGAAIGFVVGSAAVAFLKSEASKSDDASRPVRN